MDKKIKATEEQLAYANILELGMKAGLLLLIVIFIIYLSGLLPAHVPVRDLPKYWACRCINILRLHISIRDGPGCT